MRSRLPLVAIAIVVAIVVLGPALVVAIRADRGSASFGDHVDVGVNHVSAAEVAIEVGARTVRLSHDNLAPGDTVIGRFELVNDGTVPVHISIDAIPTTSPLAPWMRWRYAWSLDGDTCPSDPAEGRAADAAELGDRPLALGGSDLLCVTASLALDAPNDVQATRLDQQFRVVAVQDEVAP